MSNVNVMLYANAVNNLNHEVAPQLTYSSSRIRGFNNVFSPHLWLILVKAPLLFSCRGIDVNNHIFSFL